MPTKKELIKKPDTQLLKQTGVFLLFFIIFFISIASISIFFLFLNTIISIPALIISAIFLLILVIANHFIYTDAYASITVASFFAAMITGVVVALIYIAPMISIAQYPISMQVFYSNHPNLTITQNCTPFTTTSSSYLNGQPINSQNTTTCILPQSMNPYSFSNPNPFTCDILNKSMTCTGTNYGNVTWQGKILNVSKRD